MFEEMEDLGEDLSLISLNFLVYEAIKFSENIIYMREARSECPSW